MTLVQARDGAYLNMDTVGRLAVRPTGAHSWAAVAFLSDTLSAPVGPERDSPDVARTDLDHIAQLVARQRVVTQTDVAQMVAT